MIPLKRPEGEEQKDAEIVEDNDETRPDLIHIILLNRTLRIIIVMVISAILLPIAFYLIYFSREITEGIRKVEFGSCSHPALYHVPCGYEVKEFLIDPIIIFILMSFNTYHTFS